MKDFSPAQSKRITEVSIEIANRRAVVERMQGELEILRENLKIAKQELQFAYSDLDSTTIDALSGKEPLPNIFEGRASQK